MITILRKDNSEPSGYVKSVPIEVAARAASRRRELELEVAIAQVLAGVSCFDRTVAESLMQHTAVETAEQLRVSRATVYRAIERLRSALIAGGFDERRKVSKLERKRGADRGRLQ